MFIHLEYKNLFFKTVILSVLIHAVIIYGVVFTMRTVSPLPTTFLSFLGSILNEEDVAYRASSSKINKTSIESTLGIDYGRGILAQRPLNPRKPDSADKKLNQKIYLKATFLEPQEPIASAPEQNLDENLQLKEPLHVPLKLESNDQN